MSPAAPGPPEDLQGERGKAQVLSVDELAGVVEDLKARGLRVVFANGCFDVLHAGHVRHLRGARRLGDALIVAVNDDASTRALKGEGRPWTPQEDRLEILSALRCVDYLVLFGERDVSGLLGRLKPHVHAKGTDYTADSVPEREAVIRYGGKIAITGDEKARSSTDLVARLRSAEAGGPARG